MKRSDRNKLRFLRNWKLPGSFRLLKLIPLSKDVKTDLKDGIVWLSDENIAIYTTTDNYVEDLVLRSGDYEIAINKLINISLKPGSVALDVGANIGIQSLRMSQCVGKDGIVLSFEPIKHLQEKFLKNISLNKCDNVTLFPFALSNKDEMLNILVDDKEWNQGSFSLSSLNKGSTKQELTVKTGDNIIEIQSLERLDLIKIDVEGYEYQVMLGLANTIKKHRPRIHFECDDNYWAKTGQRLEDGISFLKDLNYKVYQINEFGCELLIDIQSLNTDNLFCIPS